MKENRSASFLGSCVCQLLQNTPEKLCFWLKGTACPRNISTWDKSPLSGPLVEMNWTDCRFQDSGASDTPLDSSPPWLCLENMTTLKPETTSEELSSFSTAATALSGSIGVVALILLLAGVLSMTLKKWRHERLFKKQLKHQTNLLRKSLELSCHTDAVYSNVINLAPWREDDFVVYANVPPFDHPRRTSPHQVEYASIVLH